MNAIRWRGWLVAGAIFVLGFAAGGATMAFLGTRWVRQTLRAPVEEPGRADRIAARIGADLTQELKLTADESARVQAALDQSAANFKALRVQTALRAAAELRAATDRIAAALPPEKRAEFRALSGRRFERLGFLLPAGADESRR